MQQSIYNISVQDPTGIQSQSQPLERMSGADTSQAAYVLQWVTRKWDLVGVVLLMGSSAAYAVFALAHLGF